MQFERSSGVLLHITSLPSPGGIGDLGPAAYAFVDFLRSAKQHIWQVLPLSPTSFGNSPYAGSSAFAGNTLLVSLEFLAQWGWIGADRIADELAAAGNVDYDVVEARKLPLLMEAAANFLEHAPHSPAMSEQWNSFVAFCTAESYWLDDYALYAVLRRHFHTGAWTTWPEALRHRKSAAIAEARATHVRAIAVEQVLQFAFDLQWRTLRVLAAQAGVRILGDVAIFVNMDSADVWVNPMLFELDEHLQPVRVAGVPPDYFSPTGQRWGNPLYRWDLLAKSGYAWWAARMRRACDLYDLIRLDHFRGFEAYWAIPAEEKTAVKGEWVQGPGAALFRALEAALGPLPLVAEDLGVITEEVEQLREELELPGMKVLQFGFSNPEAHNHLPHFYDPWTVVYTGTHDNDTTLGWWNSASITERQSVETLFGPVGERPVWPLIRAAMASVASIAMVPAQDLLELDSFARMNTPAIPAGNWSWRAPQGAFTPELAARLCALTEVTDRDNDPLA